MTTAAWTMMLTTWAIIAFFTVRFFVKVLTTPPRPEEEGHEKPHVPFKDA